jgi:hypothetical protein
MQGTVDAEKSPVIAEPFYAKCPPMSLKPRVGCYIHRGLVPPGTNIVITLFVPFVLVFVREAVSCLLCSRQASLTKSKANVVGNDMQDQDWKPAALVGVESSSLEESVFELPHEELLRLLFSSSSMEKTKSLCSSSILLVLTGERSIRLLGPTDDE